MANNAFRPYPGRVYQIREGACADRYYNPMTKTWEQTPETDHLAMIVALYPNNEKKRRHSRKTNPVVGWDILVFWLSSTKHAQVERLYVTDAHPVFGTQSRKNWMYVF